MLFFELSSFAGERTVLVESAKLVLDVVGSGRVVVVQRGPGAGGGVVLDSILVEEEDSKVEVEMEVMLVILVLS